MSGVFRLAWRYVAFHRLRTALMVAAIAITASLPLAAHLLIGHYRAALTVRAEETPLVLGAKGDRFNLVLKALYFGAADAGEITMADVHAAGADDLGRVIPLHLRYTARGFPIVGTTLDYFDFRGLKVAEGSLPLRLGQAVIGSEAAAALGLKPGDTLTSDQAAIFDISRTYPLKMHVAGVLGRRDAPDDRGVFVDLKTAWIIDGISHGHQDVTAQDVDPKIILEREAGEVKTNAAIMEYTEVTADNIASFHTHAEPAALPVSAAIVVPADAKSATLLKGRYSVSPDRRLLEADAVVGELMDLVFRAKRFFDASFVLVAVAAGLFIVVVLILSRQLRSREMQSMHRIGCSRWTTVQLQAVELGIVIALGAAVAGATVQIALWFAPQVSALV